MFVKRPWQIDCLPPESRSFIGEHDAPDMIGQVTFEGAPGGSGLSTRGDCLVVIGAPSAGGHLDLYHSDGVERAAELSVAVAGEPVPAGVGAGDLHRCRAFVVRIGRRGREAIGLPVRPISRAAATAPMPSTARRWVLCSLRAADICFLVRGELDSEASDVGDQVPAQPDPHSVDRTLGPEVSQSPTAP